MVLDAGKSKIKVPIDLESDEDVFPSSYMAPSSSVYMWRKKGARQVFGSIFKRVLIT